ncbi:hypothetical protein BaRGS_00031202 [Batillaria attramentaria]|uniref:Uncharacterized protein n=1 Tax=Batillaria attramentaria TaxID=370345 RepID=A0ABD0JRE8_9CAEN
MPLTLIIRDARRTMERGRNLMNNTIVTAVASLTVTSRSDVLRDDPTLNRQPTGGFRRAARVKIPSQFQHSFQTRAQRDR